MTRGHIRRRRFVAASLTLICCFPIRAYAQDASTILNKMYAAYAALNSYTQKTSVTVTNAIAGTTRSAGSIAEVRYLKPNKMFLVVSSPAGTITSASNGREHISYSSGINQFTKSPAPATASGFLAGVRKIGIDVKAVEPFAFLCGGRLPPQVSGIASHGKVSLNGAECYLLEGKVTGASKGSVSFWVDTHSYLLRKVQAATTTPAAVMVRGSKNGKPIAERRSVAVTGRLSEVVQEFQVNPPLNDSMFAFSIPQGAVEKNLEKYLKK